MDRASMISTISDMIDGSCLHQIVLQKILLLVKKRKTKNELSNVMKDKSILTLIHFGMLDTYMLLKWLQRM